MREINTHYSRFLLWLYQINLRDLSRASLNIVFEERSDDGLLTANENDQTLSFNLSYLDKGGTLDFFIITVLHEAYHAYVNQIPNKKDATRVKDFYRNEMMLHIDVEADYYVAKYFKEQAGWDFEKFLSVYYSGVEVFRDAEIRPLKFERYLCSMFTLAHLFAHHEFVLYRISAESIRISKFSPYAIVHYERHTEARRIDITSNDLEDLELYYQEGHMNTSLEYVIGVASICNKAVGVRNDKLPSIPRPNIKYRLRNTSPSMMHRQSVLRKRNYPRRDDSEDFSES